MPLSDPSILEKCLAHAEAQTAITEFYFHGTNAAIAGNLRPGGSDGVFWCAETPSVAQNYISTGTKALITKEDHALNDRVSPSRFGHGLLILKSMGFTEEQFEAEYDIHGKMKSYRIPAGHPRNAEAYAWLEQTMGYRPDKGIYKVLIDRWGDAARIKRQAEKEVGHLLIVEKDSSFKWLDLRQGDTGDLQSPEHLKLKRFREAEEKGFDGVIINDYTQSERHGNVPHVSWGFLPSTGLPKLHYTKIKAGNFDWDAGGIPGGSIVTSEFKSAFDQVIHARQKRTAITLSL